MQQQSMKSPCRNRKKQPWVFVCLCICECVCSDRLNKCSGGGPVLGGMGGGGDPKAMSGS